MAGTVMSTPGGGRGGVEVTRLKVDPRDPKPLPTRQRMANEISSYLATIGEHVEPKTLLTPTAKDFKQILKTLISRLDRTYPFAMAPTTTGQQKGATGNQWTEEVIPALKVMMYPFPESITKSHLHAIGSQTSWPNMLAMLHWFVTLILVRYFISLFCSRFFVNKRSDNDDRTEKQLSIMRPSYTFQLPTTRRILSLEPMEMLTLGWIMRVNVILNS